MLNKIKSFIQEHHLLQPDGHYLVAVSGGADSVCLLLILQQLGYHIEAAHCNFHLRGAESDRDEMFVKELCHRKGIPLHLTHFDTKTYAQLHKVSIEMAARALRYHYFEQLLHDINASGICVAHHQDDSIETILINLFRGTGIHGLSGIKPRNGHILRPLLGVSRQDIEGWLKHQGQDYVIDSTNLESNILRNKLRNDIIPELQQLLPSVKHSITESSIRIGTACDVYDNAMTSALQRLIKDNTIVIDSLTAEPSPESILFEWLKPLGFSSNSIETIEKAVTTQQAGKVWYSDTHQLTINRGKLLLEELQDTLPTLRIPEEGKYIYTPSQSITIKHSTARDIIKDRFSIRLDRTHITYPLTLRPIKTGDRFHPLGMKGTKLVSDYLTDRHLSIFEKKRTLVLCNADGQIIWLIGHCPDSLFCIHEHTETTIEIALG